MGPQTQPRVRAVELELELDRERFAVRRRRVDGVVIQVVRVVRALKQLWSLLHLQMVWWGIGGNVTPIACRLAKRPGLGGVQDYQRVKLTAAAGMSVSTDSSCAHRFELKRLCYDSQGTWL